MALTWHCHLSKGTEREFSWCQKKKKKKMPLSFIKKKKKKKARLSLNKI
jgi:hypothetical protein